MLSDWIVWRLARVHVTEPSCGSSSGMFSLACRTGRRASRTLRPLPQVLPEVADPGTVVGAVTAEAAAQTGLRASTGGRMGADTQLGLLGAGVRAGEFTCWLRHVLGRTPSSPRSRSSTRRPGCGPRAT
jgi:autoinducer 2 (AI-2) kinase